MPELARGLSRALRPVADELRGRGTYVYDPSDYAWEPHAHYLREYARGDAAVVLLGMNPGPWGMAQCGVPFGAVNWARDWLRIEGAITLPAGTHPARPVQGWACRRVEVSGDRLWGMLQRRFGTPQEMRRHVAVINYCPLLLLEASGKGCRNLPLANVRGARRLLAACDEHLAAALAVLRPRLAVGVGTWATARLRAVAGADLEIGQMLHPSPASPLANRGFEPQATAQLHALGVPVAGADVRK